MIIGVPKEIKKDEYRVAMTPAGVHRLKSRGHRVRVQAGAGVGSGISDAEYRRAGAEIVQSAAQIFKTADLIVKVKEPQPSECRLLRRGQLVFTYFHLAADKPLTLALMKSGVDGDRVRDDRAGVAAACRC